MGGLGFEGFLGFAYTQECTWLWIHEEDNFTISGKFIVGWVGA